MRTEQEMCQYPANFCIGKYLAQYQELNRSLIRFPIPYGVGGVIIECACVDLYTSTLEAWLKNVHCGYKANSVALFAGFYLNV